MLALKAARELGLNSWGIGAGLVRSLVWDHLHGFEEPSPCADVDLVFYCPDGLGSLQEQSIERTLSTKAPGLQWEAVNQASVHQWLQSQSPGHVIPAFKSLADGIASWPETATCVGVMLDAADEIGVIAPHGLSDLFNMVVRWNPTRVSRATFEERVASKRWGARWPRVKVLPC